ncbi:MAG: 30S ribosomal protein S9 [Bacteroidota bacterium]
MEKNVAVGRRKASIARVFISKGNGAITVNGKEHKEYFPVVYLQHKVEAPFAHSGLGASYDVKVNVNGGGVKGQAEAVAMGISRAILLVSPDSKPVLKKERLLTRDARVVERKKPGLRKARKKEQFSKR